MTARCDECQTVYLITHCVQEALSKSNNFCSQQCVRKSTLVRLKKETTCLQRYGVRVSSQSQQAKDVYRTTCLKKFGSTSVFGAPFFHAKREIRLLERFGVSHFSKFPSVQDKIARSTNKATVERHWKTNDELLCVGSWELAVVRWLNANKTDYEWQPGPFMMPNGHTYRPDTLITTGLFANTYIEVKGYMRPDAQTKWEWFHDEHPNSELWNGTRLRELNILPNKRAKLLQR